MSQSTNYQVNRKELIKLYRQALLEQGSFEQVDTQVKSRLARLEATEKIENSVDQQHQKQAIRSVPAIIRLGASLVPVLLIFVGLFLLGSAMVPIFGYYLRNISAAPALIAPIPQENILTSTTLAVTQSSALDQNNQDLIQFRRGPMIVDAELDYTNLSNWFEDRLSTDLVNRTSLLSKQTGEYILDIPKIEINNALVAIGGTNLDENLIQYPGTALPGKPGAPVIFGHSLLRQFYNPRENNPRRYNSIFSTIMTLQPGDKIYLRYGDVRYTYLVQDKMEVNPTDTYILSQDYNNRLLKLVTCVPEGTYLRRGVVTAQLIKDE